MQGPCPYLSCLICVDVLFMSANWKDIVEKRDKEQTRRVREKMPRGTFSWDVSENGTGKPYITRPERTSARLLTLWNSAGIE